MTKMLNVFKGPNAVRDFLDPGKQPYLPLVEIPQTLNPFAADRVRIFAKLMSHSPLANVKAVPAFNMMREHYRRGDLDGVSRAVESSSGNTVFSIALAARQFGVEKTLSFVPHEISWHKLLMLRFFGVEPIVNQEPPHPDTGDPRSGVYKARKRGKRKGWINPGQYDNPDNPKSLDRQADLGTDRRAHQRVLRGSGHHRHRHRQRTLSEAQERQRADRRRHA